MFLKKIINSIADAGKELLNKALPVQKNLETLLELCDDLISYKGVASGIAIAREISEIYLFLSKEDKKITLFGVRAGDVKKLDKETWVNFEQFYVDFGKKLLKKNMDKANDVHAYQKIKEIIYKDSEMNKFARSLGSLFQNRHFNMDSDHKVGQAKELWMIGMGDVDNQILCLHYEINRDDPKWLEENLNEVISTESFKDLINEINEKYPLLKNIGEQISTWTDLSEDNFNENIKQYISMCDRVGGE